MAHTDDDLDLDTDAGVEPTPAELLASEVAFLRRDAEEIDAMLGLAGPGRTRFHGDRVVRLRSLLAELENYRNAARAAREVR